MRFFQATHTVEGHVVLLVTSRLHQATSGLQWPTPC